MVWWWFWANIGGLRNKNAFNTITNTMSFNTMSSYYHKNIFWVLRKWLGGLDVVWVVWR